MQSMFIRALKALLPLCCAFLLNGCVGLAVSGVSYVADSSTISSNMEKAEAGDALAQYKVGDAYCCGKPGAHGTKKDSEKATEWLCKSAHQGNGQAQYELGKIYLGEAGGAWGGPVSWVRSAMTEKKSDPALALVWLKQAQAQGVSGADAKVAELEHKLPAPDLAKSAAWSENWQAAPCIWREVFPDLAGMTAAVH